MDEKDFIEISKKFMDEYPTKFLNPNKEKYYKRFYKYCEKNNLDMNKNTAYEWLLKEVEEDHYDIMITNPNAKEKDIEKDKKKMAEEKEQAQRVMLTMSAKLKETLDKKAEELGINTTQYIINLIINDIKEK
ncbi:hypothetical protein [Campylobacter sp. IFREMER_LSEM_CL1085]|uniref:hypothetical protein n=1 Tax=Campylobacter sp. IFREMER_LSEM_CL1085 TaxID=2911612 RepID=UPI0021E6A94D|nr:hypothetical protein [Campylobacter sp. IFREMER_LSEM_CL1085]MCV3424495.1 hypothetical protein [Campylobacter sp. IFREMER_LSEM_CL1085]